MGRRAKPAALKRAQGNPGKRPIAEEPPELPIEEPTRVPTPNHLTKAAGEIWRMLAPELARMKFLRETDRPTFERYCEWLAKWWKAERALRKKSFVITTKSKHGEMDRINRYLQIQLLVEKRLEAFEDRFGLNPRARYQILQQLANRPWELPLDPGEEAPEQDQAPAPASSPIGCLNAGKSVH